MDDKIDLDKDVLMTTKEAAKLVRVHLSCLYRWIEDGRLKAWKMAGRLVVRRADVEALLVPVQPRRDRRPPPDLAQRPRVGHTSAADLEFLRKRGFKV